MYQTKEKKGTYSVPIQMRAKKNRSNPLAIPQPTKSLFEVSSGYSLDEVRVHRQSDYPAQFQARACTVGPDIYLAPGQETSLPHELGHVLQNALHPVKPTGYVGSQPVNTSPVLEREADNLAARIQTGFPTVSAKRLTRPKFGAAVQGDDFSASVSLVPAGAGFFKSENLLVDTIKLSGRTKTAMPDGKQGDHTIADAFIKKYQKAMVREKNIGNFLDFYHNLLNKLKVDGAYPSANGYNEKRFDNLTSTLDAELNIAHNIGQGDGAPMTVWRRTLTNILFLYNNAYSHSRYATTPGHSGGKSESEGMGALRKMLAQNNFAELITINGQLEESEKAAFQNGDIRQITSLILNHKLDINQQIMTLLDLESAERSNDSKYILTEFVNMLYTISSTENHRNKTMQSVQDGDPLKYLYTRKRTDYRGTNPVTFLERGRDTARLSIVDNVPQIRPSSQTAIPFQGLKSIVHDQNFIQDEREQINFQKLEELIEEFQYKIPISSNQEKFLLQTFITSQLEQQALLPTPLFTSSEELVSLFSNFLDEALNAYYQQKSDDFFSLLLSRLISNESVEKMIDKIIQDGLYDIVFKLFENLPRDSQVFSVLQSMGKNIFTSINQATFLKCLNSISLDEEKIPTIFEIFFIDNDEASQDLLTETIEYLQS